MKRKTKKKKKKNYHHLSPVEFGKLSLKCRMSEKFEIPLQLIPIIFFIRNAA